MKKYYTYFKKIISKVYRKKLFFYVFALPSALVTLYYGFIASNQYVTESKFIIRSPQQQSSNDALGLFLRGTNFARALDDIYSARDFINSRDAMRKLDEDLALKDKFQAFNIDLLSKFSPLGLDDSDESFYKYYKNKVVLSQDSLSSILTLETLAYDSSTSYQMNIKLLGYAEDLVNELNDRAKKDIIQYSENELKIATDLAVSTRVAIADYRNQNKIIDPERQSVIQLQLLSKIQDSLIKAKAELSHMISISPDNPNIESQKTLIKSLEKELDDASYLAAGSDDSFASQSTEYVKLFNENLFAEKQLLASLSEYEKAKNDALRQQFYLEMIVEPKAPDRSTEPKRLRTIISTLLLLLVAWGIARFLLTAIKEHNDS
jgi:capsular polysaccharide transport system permease protein